MEDVASAAQMFNCIKVTIMWPWVSLNLSSFTLIQLQGIKEGLFVFNVFEQAGQEEEEEEEEAEEGEAEEREAEEEEEGNEGKITADYYLAMQRVFLVVSVAKISCIIMREDK